MENNKTKYDFLIVGAGLFGSVCAHELKKRGYNCLVIDKRNHIAGNIYTKSIDGIMVHVYGAHIFHTSNKKVWDYITQFGEFNNYVNSPIARYKDEIYNLPFNMNTFSKLWKDVYTPDQAKKHIEEEKKDFFINEPKNLEEQAINLVGKTIYEKLIKGYTAKQWGRPCSELPPFIIKRLPVRFVFDNNYFNDRYQGIPIDGYTSIIEKMLDGIDVYLNCDFFDDRNKWTKMANKIIFTGQIDRFFDYKHGPLEYRSVRFENEILDTSNYQGNAVVNYTEYEVPFTRIIEHKHFMFDSSSPRTVISREYSSTWKIGDDPYYPINNKTNEDIYELYKEEAKRIENVFFGGRLGQYKYFDMDKTVLEALSFIEKIK